MQKKTLEQDENEQVEEHGLEAAKKEINAVIAKSGHAVIATEIEIGDVTIPMSFTVGLSRVNRPEFIVFALDHETARVLLNSSAEIFKEGVFVVNEEVNSIAKGLSVIFKEALIEKVRLVTHAMEYFAEVDSPRVLQLIWPDEKNFFPWMPEFKESLRVLQPLLF